MTINASRRTVVAGAAWAVPAVTIAAAAPAYAASCNLTSDNPVIWQDLTVTVYARVRTRAVALGTIVNYTDSMSKIDYTFRVPQYVLAGATVAPQPISYTSALSTEGTSAAYTGSSGIGGREVLSGVVNTSYNFGGGATGAFPATMNLTGPVNIPSSGQLVTQFAGNMPSLTATTPGVYDISFVDPVPLTPTQGTGAADIASYSSGEQLVRTSNAFVGNVPARVHSLIPTTIPATPSNDWGVAGQSQSLTFGTFTVVSATDQVPCVI